MIVTEITNYLNYATLMVKNQTPENIYALIYCRRLLASRMSQIARLFFNAACVCLAQTPSLALVAIYRVISNHYEYFQQGYEKLKTLKISENS